MYLLSVQASLVLIYAPTSCGDKKLPKPLITQRSAQVKSDTLSQAKTQMLEYFFFIV